jgi:RNA-binding protein
MPNLMRQGRRAGHDTLPALIRPSAGPLRCPDSLRDASRMFTLTNAQIRFLRGQAHGLKAMLQIGAKGLTDAVAAEVDLALEHHELIKVKVAAEDREARDAMVADLAGRSGAALVQRIGNVAVLYRQSKDHRQIVLPRA